MSFVVFDDNEGGTSVVRRWRSRRFAVEGNALRYPPNLLSDFLFFAALYPPTKPKSEERISVMIDNISKRNASRDVNGLFWCGLANTKSFLLYVMRFEEN